jgi:hypothetical protein
MDSCFSKAKVNECIEEMKHEWKFFAKVIDRLCLWCFITIYVVISLTLFIRQQMHARQRRTQAS